MSVPENLRPFLGRWVALLQERVVGVGLTAAEARLAAQLSRPKEKPKVIFVSEPTSIQLPPLVADIRASLPPQSKVWLVGGAPRDILLNRRLHDLDFVTAEDALALARTVAHKLKAAFYPLDEERGVGRVILDHAEGHFTLDFARLRGDSLETDLQARDFTINAMAVDLDQPDLLIDPLHGEMHLRTKRLSACSPTAISDDPIRAIRAIRLAAQLNFKLDSETRAAVRAQATALAETSPERRRDEFIRCLGGPRPALALRALELLGLLPAILPELAALKGVTQSPPHVFDVWEHTLQVVARLEEVLHILAPRHDVDAASDVTLGLVSVQLGRHRQAFADHLDTPLSSDRPARWSLMLAALLHDLGKPATRTVEADGRIRFFNHEDVGAEQASARLSHLRFSSDEIKRVKTIVAHHLRPMLLAQEAEVSRRAIYRFFRATREAGVEVVLLSLADVLATYGDGPPPQDAWARHVALCAQLLRAYFETPEESVKPPTLLSGHDLISEFQLPPGPQIGELLEVVREAQATGEITERTAALEFVRQKLGMK